MRWTIAGNGIGRRNFYKQIDDEIILGPLIYGLQITIYVAFWGMIASAYYRAFYRNFAPFNSMSGRIVARCYLEIIRNTPLLVQVSIFYFVLQLSLESTIQCGQGSCALHFLKDHLLLRLFEQALFLWREVNGRPQKRLA